MNFDRFQTSLGEVFEVIKASDDKKKMKSVFASNPKFKSLENEAVSAIHRYLAESKQNRGNPPQ